MPPVKVVAHLRDGSIIKGLSDIQPGTELGSTYGGDFPSMPKELILCLPDSDRQVHVYTNDLKALFFVRTFEGNKDYNEVKFFEGNPSVEGLWTRIKFYDNETTEGVVRNSIHLLVEPGFFVKPPDPESNNKLVYVVKKALADFYVLGISFKY